MNINLGGYDPGSPDEFESRRYWQHVLEQLHALYLQELPLLKFDEWLLQEYKIEVIHGNLENYRSGIVGLKVPDDQVAFLYLKYPDPSQNTFFFSYKGVSPIDPGYYYCPYIPPDFDCEE